MSNRHIQKSGVKEGQWVSCPAKVSCRNKGTHINDNELKDMQSWKQKQIDNYVLLKDLTLKDYEDYKDSVIKPVIYNAAQQKNYYAVLDASLAYVNMDTRTSTYDQVAKAREINKLARQANYDESLLVPRFNAAREIENKEERTKAISSVLRNLRCLRMDVENQNPFGTTKTRRAQDAKNK